MIDGNYKLLEKEIAHLKELMKQHHELTQMASLKAQETLDERLSKMNEFREQQKDIIERFADQKETSAALLNLDTLFKKSIENLQMQSERTDTQINKLIADNAKVSNDALASLNKWRESSQGSIRVILAIGSFIAAIVLALLIGFLKTIFK